MKLSKQFVTELTTLFGPNGVDTIVHESEIRRIQVFKELERHGLVKLTTTEGLNSHRFKVARTLGTGTNARPVLVAFCADVKHELALLRKPTK